MRKSRLAKTENGANSAKEINMMMPSYIKRADIVDCPIQYNWNDADPGLLYLEDERLANRIGKICYRGIIALSAGFAEWIAWRLSKHCTDPVLFHEIEAVWAGIIDWRYMRPLGRSSKAPERKDWHGAERGPVRSAFFLLSQVVSITMRSAYPAPAASSLARLALHIMPNPKPFKDWRRFAIQRLSEIYPKQRENKLGPSIPKEVLDPDFNYEPTMTNELLLKFLQNLDFKKNPFLCSPEEMIRNGFEGTPYTL
jgi:hypothetical protein